MSDGWYAICHVSRVMYDVRCMMCDVWNVIYDVWYVMTDESCVNEKYDVWYLMCDVWDVMWYVNCAVQLPICEVVCIICYMWYVMYDVLCVIFVVWCMRGVSRVRDYLNLIKRIIQEMEMFCSIKRSVFHEETHNSCNLPVFWINI